MITPIARFENAQFVVQAKERQTVLASHFNVIGIQKGPRIYP
jgi:hypothetical protein